MGLGGALGVLLLGLLAYWPALDNPFIADDYALLLGAEKAVEHCADLLAMPLGGRRLLANLFFTVCFWLYGATPFLFYLTNLVLHILCAALVGRLVRAVTGREAAAVAAALFFVAYERHQEPVFWVGTQHELLLSLGVLGTVLAFLRWRQSERRGWYALALGLFVASAFTKESFIILPPLLLLADLCRAGKRPGRWWLAHVPFAALTLGYSALMYVGPWPYPFGETQSGLTLHFFSVYLRSLNRLLLFVYGFLALAWVVNRVRKERFAPVRERSFWLFLGWLALTIVPYSFILYERQLSSRHTYIPSVATAALVGLLFAFIWERSSARGGRLVWAAALAVCLAGNVAAIWRKDAQYLERAAPTEQLILRLNEDAELIQQYNRVTIVAFPYPPVVARGAARFFTNVPSKKLRFLRGPEAVLVEGYILQWNSHTRRMEREIIPTTR